MTLYFFLRFFGWRKVSEMESCRVNGESRWYLDVTKKPPCRRWNGEKFVSACMQHCCVQTAVMAQPELQIFVLRHSHELLVLFCPLLCPPPLHPCSSSCSFFSSLCLTSFFRKQFLRNWKRFFYLSILVYTCICHSLVYVFFKFN